MTIQTVITDRGRAILAGRVPGDPPLASIKIAVGDGNGNFPVPNPAQTMLVNERWRGDGQAALNGDKLGFVVTIPAAVGGWPIREVGVYVGPAGAEELLVVSQFDGRLKPAAGENGASALTIVAAIDYSGSVVGAFNITLDQDLASVDPNVFRVVVGRLQVPPGDAPSGACYAVAANPTGVWAGKGGQIARRKGTAWAFEVPIAGHIVRDGAGALYQKSGADYVPYYPPLAGHDHDDRYYTEAEVNTLIAGKSDVGHGHDTRYVMIAPPGGAPQGVQSALSAGLSQYGWATIALATSTDSAHLNIYGASAQRIGYLGHFEGNLFTIGMTETAPAIIGTAGLERLRVTPAGDVGLGVKAPGARLHVGGDALINGRIGVSGWYGDNGMVIYAQGGGLPNNYARAIDLITTPELRSRLGGGLVHCSFATQTFVPAGAPNYAPSNWQAVGCAVTAFVGSGHLYMDVAFAVPAPNAAFVVNGIPNAGISMRTVNGFRYDVGPGDSSTYNVNFSVIT